jgi:multicomponent Na+:H+ antiporter subunit D
MVPLAVAIPLLAACLLLVVGGRLPRLVVDLLSTGAAAGCLANAVVLVATTTERQEVYWLGGWSPRGGHGVGVAFVADQAGAALTTLIALLTVCALLFGWRYFDTVEPHYPVLVLLFLTGMTGFVLAGDLFTMFVFFELMGAVAYALAGYEIEEPDTVQAAFAFGVTNSLGAYFTLTGIALLYAETGQLGLAQIGAELATHEPNVLVRTGFALVCVGWLVKAAAVPFHFWLADAHAVAPAPVCVLFSGVMAPLGIYGVARVYWTTFAGTLPQVSVRAVLLGFGVVTALVGAVMAATQRHLKRMLAYSTIAHSGLFLVALAALTPDGTAGAFTYLAGHAGVKGALFLLTGMLLAFYGSVDETELHGRVVHHRVLGGLFVVAALALAGMPPFGAGLGKALAEETVGSPVLAAVFVLVSAVTGGAVLRAGLRVYFGLGTRPREPATVTAGTNERTEVRERPPHAPAPMIAAIVALLGASLALGVVPTLTELAGHAGAALTDTGGYRSAVLAGDTVAPGAAHVGWNTSGLLLSALSTVAAMLVAAMALRRPPVPAALSRIGTVLHNVHSGHVGDYAAWLLLGVGVLTGTVVLVG